MTDKKAAFLIVIVWLCSSAISFPAIAWWRATDIRPIPPLTCPFTEDIGYLVFRYVPYVWHNDTYLEVLNSNLGPSIIDGDSEGKGGGVHTSKRKVDYLSLVGGPWGVKNRENESTSIMDGPIDDTGLSLSYKNKIGPSKNIVWILTLLH